MLIENMMYFALGVLVAGLLALIILPSVWKRAVRLTKRRIEAATPITMAEFRADKDQLRAEFALTTRKLEMTIEQLRKRVAEQLSEVNQKRTEFVVLKAERDEATGITQHLEAREAELKGRVGELERESVDLAQRLRMRERELEARTQELQALREGRGADLVVPEASDAEANLSGEYDQDVGKLSEALALERKRAALLEDQAQSLIARLESSDRRSAEASAAIAQMREALANRAGKKRNKDLAAAEARIAGAEQQLNDLLGQGAPKSGQDNEPASLADELNHQDRLDALRGDVAAIEASILSSPDGVNPDADALRERLQAIAETVSGIVYTDDREADPASRTEESLFERMQRYADEEDAAIMARNGGPMSERMTAMQEIRGR
jgi:DNA repair exonuclease SbcCD ATPase subunit